MRKSTWTITLRTIVLSIALGGASGVLATALTTNYLSDYSIQLGELTAPLRLAQERPRVFPQSYQESVAEVSAKVVPGLVQVFEKKADQSFHSSAAVGQGAVLTSDGWLLSVFDKPAIANQLQVVIGSKIYDVEEVVPDSLTRITFIKILASNLPVTAFGQALDSQLGDQVFIVPSRQTLQSSAITSFNEDELWQKVVLADSVTTNSLGAPVANLAGELIGIIESSDQNIEVIPIELILPAFSSLLRSGQIERAYLGVTAINLSTSLGLDSELTRSHKQGALIADQKSIQANSPAEKAELLPGDIILSVDGQIINDHHTLDEYIMIRKPEDTVVLLVDRAGEQMEFSVTLGLDN
ncbi:S1C family serine protease [Patescibacteria group bacterium]